MPTWTARSGISTTLAGATSTGFTPKVRSFSGMSYGVDTFDTTNMSSTVGTEYVNVVPREFIAADISTAVQITVNILIDPDYMDTVPLAAAVEAWTFQFAAVGAQTTGASLVWSGTILSFDMGDVSYDALMEGSVMMQMSGEPVFTIGS